MDVLNAQTIQVKIDALRRDKKKSTKRIGQTWEKIKEWEYKKIAAEEKSIEINDQMLRLKEALVALTSIPKETNILRTTITNSLKRAKRKDITVAEVEESKIKAQNGVEELQRLCTHNFVIELLSSYEGSMTQDYDDRHPGQRVCVVCKYKEYSIKTEPSGLMRSVDIYKTLNPHDTRIIKRSLGFLLNNDKKKLLDELVESWLPLEDILEIFTPNNIKIH